MKKIVTIIYIGACSLSAQAVFAADAGINWKENQVSAVGVGVPPSRMINSVRGRLMACRAAKVDALRNLLETTKGVRVNSLSLVKDAVLESDVIKTAVEGVVRGARVRSKQVMNDGSCEVTLVMPMAGSLFSAIVSEEQFNHDVGRQSQNFLSFPKHMKELAKKIRDIGLIPEAHAGEVPELTLTNDSELTLARKLKTILAAEHDAVGEAVLDRAISSYHQIRDFTGIVIDASNVKGFEPAALPWIRDAKGEKLYPNANTPYEIVRSVMPVSYDFSIDDAVKNKRVATVPLVIQAVSTYKSKRSDLILSESGRQKFLNLLDKGYVNKNARIMIVVGD